MGLDACGDEYWEEHKRWMREINRRNIKHIDIILATKNPSKREQISKIFQGSRFNIVMPEKLGITDEAIEDGNTLQENAMKKALFIRERMPEKIWVMADDTGVFINALNGEPGIRATRWAGEHATTDDILQYTLKKLEGATDRSAEFETVVVLIAPHGEVYCFNGTAGGNFLEAPRTQPQPKMPYSAIFIPDGMDKTWAEMTVEEENAISHRGRAFKRALNFLEEYCK